MALESGVVLRYNIATQAKNIEISEMQTKGDSAAKESAAEKILAAFTSINDIEAEMREIEQTPEAARDESASQRLAELSAASQRLVTAVVFSHRRQPSRFTLAIEQPTDQAEGHNMPELVITYPHPTRRDVSYTTQASLSRFAKSAGAITGIVEAVNDRKVIPSALIRPPNQPFR